LLELFTYISPAVFSFISKHADEVSHTQLWGNRQKTITLCRGNAYRAFVQTD